MAREELASTNYILSDGPNERYFYSKSGYNGYGLKK